MTTIAPLVRRCFNKRAALCGRYDTTAADKFDSPLVRWTNETHPVLRTMSAVHRANFPSVSSAAVISAAGRFRVSDSIVFAGRDLDILPQDGACRSQGVSALDSDDPAREVHWQRRQASLRPLAVAAR